MTEFSTATRVLAALLLLVASAVAWKWLQAPAVSSGRAAASADRTRKTKKKTKKKKTNTKADAVTSAAATPSATVGHKVDEPVSESDDDSDPDAGLSVKQVLAKRRFQPKAIGGVSVAMPMVERFAVGQRVVARYQDGHDWFPGEIVEVRRGNQYHITYDDGEVEHHVPHARIKDAATVDAEEDAQARRVAEAVDAVRGDVDTGHDGNSSSGVDDDAGDASEDGWQVVATAAKKKGSRAAIPLEMEKVDADGLTKRQRENRRKKERRKEVKEAVRAQAQEHGLHARWGGSMTRLKYVPPPTNTTH